jgi:hypothetical protein
MNKKTFIILASGLLCAAVTYAATGYVMKCRAKACGYQKRLTLGPTMMSGRITGYCKACSDFVAVSWKTRDMRTGETNIEPKPEALGQVWDCQTGSTLTIYPCPKCKGPFAEIKKHKDVTHCPSCNDPGFGIDKDAPVMAVD